MTSLTCSTLISRFNIGPHQQPSRTYNLRILIDLAASCGMLDDQFYSISSGIRLKHGRRCC